MSPQLSYGGDAAAADTMGAPATDTASVRPAPARSGPSPSALGWSVLGFVAGIAFWHAVGFWGFVQEAVFSGPRLQVGPSVAASHVDEAALASSSRSPRAVSDISTGSLPGNTPADARSHEKREPPPAIAHQCASLELDRSTGSVRAHHCAATVPPLAAGTATRGDRLDVSMSVETPATGPLGWAPQIEPESGSTSAPAAGSR
ncbi:MAG: hypothetical protein NW217_09065 [Hyphomicrobiaceae bacterium]|nr:hypothetical protein [Hyphomicrobiaceae bacterium]